MKIKLTVLFICISCAGFVRAQQSGMEEGADRLALSVWIPDNIDGLTAPARQNLHNRITQIVTKHGVYADPSYSRFICTANVIMQDKHIVPGAPPKHLYKLDITFYIGDGIVGSVFSSYNTSVTGVGESETKAYMNAIKSIRTDNADYQSFIEQGKNRIIAYFNSQCDQIIKEAGTYAEMQQYDDALRTLSTVPNVCTACWDKCMNAAIPIFQQQIDLDCKSLMLNATNVWNAGQNWDAADQAGQILSEINPHSKCFNEALALSEKIGKRIKEVDRREWNFHYEKEIGLQKSIINAYRDIAVAYAKNQPKRTVIYKTLW
ncbi:MAG: hypothetical protein LBP50_05020 [Tannerella sp.]|jgi:hypothetical protein|nr:hypothetical protein [Tannerella sp.]